jgi:uncharacterized protein YyaL (SSP411 family)
LLNVGLSPIAAIKSDKPGAASVLEASRKMWAVAYEGGYDRDEGGFRQQAELVENEWLRPASRDWKSFWTQAEGLVATMAMQDATGDQRFNKAFGHHLSFVERHMVAWDRGEWYEDVTDGKPSGDASNDYKGPYHTGRAVLRCLEMLRDDDEVEPED